MTTIPLLPIALNMTFRPVVALAILISISITSAHQTPLPDIDPSHLEPWHSKYGSASDLPFSGPLSFSRIPQYRCLSNPTEKFDIAVLGMPFDTGTTYRPGARFGPFAIRAGSRRQGRTEGYTLNWMNNPYAKDVKIVDCGDVNGFLA